MLVDQTAVHEMGLPVLTQVALPQMGEVCLPQFLQEVVENYSLREVGGPTYNVDD